MSVNLTNLQRAIAGWGEDMPAWVRLLANAADRTSQRQVADRLDMKHPTISRIIRHDYPASYRHVETLVRAAFGTEVVACPINGEIPLSSCVRARRRTIAPRHAAALAWARTCPTCPYNTDAKDDRP